MKHYHSFKPGIINSPVIFTWMPTKISEIKHPNNITYSCKGRGHPSYWGMFLKWRGGAAHDIPCDSRLGPDSAGAVFAEIARLVPSYQGLGGDALGDD